MPSSTSSSKEPQSLPRRVLAALGLAVILIALLGLIRPQSAARGVPEAAFWANKLDAPAQYDMVIAGCSRVYRGFAPQAMAEFLPDYRILNFGFSSLGYSRQYLDAVEKVLDPASPRRTIILGVQPRNFLEHNGRVNGFTDLAHTKRAARWLVRHGGPLVRLLAPYPVEKLAKQKLTGVTYHEHYYPDGWVAAWKDPEDPQEYVKADRAAIASAGPRSVDGVVIDETLAAVRRWTAQGIKVYAVRIPTNAQMAALENGFRGFDPPALQRRFAAAGATFLTVAEPDRYHSYDGSHLRQDGALLLSRDVAYAISRHQSRVVPAPGTPATPGT